MGEKRATHQVIILHCPLAPKFGELPPLTLKRPSLHLFICHELQRERRAVVEPVSTLVTVYRAEPAWGIRIDGGSNNVKRRHVL